MDNVIIIEADSRHTTAAADFGTFSISLTNCIVTHDGNNTYPVDAVPSTLRLGLTSEGEKVMKMNEGGVFHSSLEESVMFDFTLALEILDRDGAVEKLRVDSELGGSSHEELAQCVIGPTNSPNSQVESIMRMLDEETHFLKIALSGLGVFGSILVLAFVWTGYKISHRKTRRVVRIVDSLPREIRTRSPSREEMSLELSPLRHRSAVHETLHLVALRDTPVAVPDASPRHWYEEFLSPRLEGRDGRGSIAAAGDAASSDGRGIDGASRALFSERRVSDVADRPIQDANEPSVAGNTYVALVNDEVTVQKNPTHDADVATSDDRHGLIVENSSPEPMHLDEVCEIEPESNTKAETIAQTDHNEPPGEIKANQDKLPVESKCSKSQKFTTSGLETKLQEHHETFSPTRSSFSPKLSSINILELAEHIETSSTPFPKRGSSTTIVTPEEIKNLSEKIREPSVALSLAGADVVLTDDVLDHSNAIDDHAQAQIIAEKTNPRVTTSSFQTSVVKLNSPVHHQKEERYEVSSLADSMSSASLLVSLESNSGLYKESVQFVPSAFGMEVPEKANVTVDSVSLNEKVQLSHDSRSIADSILSASLLVSVDADTDIDSISDDEQAVSPSIQSNEADVLPDDKIQSEDISEEPDHIKEKEMSAHRMKHNVIQ
jgi:hypothetical protein